MLTCEFATWNVLIIDNDVESLNLVSALFKKQGIRITTFYNVSEGLQAIQDNDFNILLLDLMLPHFSGFEIHAMLRKLAQQDEFKELSELVIIAFTAIEEKVALAQQGKEGFDGWIFKPFNPNTLFSLMRSFVSEFLVSHGRAPCPPTA